MRSLAHLNKYFYRYRIRLLLGVLFVTISNIFAVYPAQIIRHALDYVSEASRLYGIAGSGAIREDLFRYFAGAVFVFGVIILLMALLKGIFMFFMRQTIIVVSRYIEYDLKNEIFDHYQKLSLSFYRVQNTGDLMARISEDVGRVRMYVGPAVMYTIKLVVLFILVIAAMINVNARLTLYVLLPLPVLAFAIYYVSHLVNKKSEGVQRQLSTLSTYTQEAFSGIRVLKAFSRKEISATGFEKESDIYRGRYMGLARVNAFFTPLMLLLIGLSTLITICVGGMEAMAGRITYGNIAEFIIYVNQLTWPVASVGWVTSLVQRAAASQERINEFLRISPDIPAGQGQRIEVEGEVEFDRVTFIYPDSGIRALDDISFRIPKGKSVAVLGETGSGKSTVAALLTRMYDSTEGIIRIDGKDIRSIESGSIRSQIGYVPQDVFLFSDTIASNIAFGLKEESEESLKARIHQAAKDAAVYDNIMEFPDGFDTRIGERGITLSGGQKQRVSIARAIIKEPRILIFDDCLSAVDTQTEEKILASLQRIMKGRTSLIISHRVSSVKHASHIILLENGRIIEEGSHEELMARKGAYFTIYEKQILEETTG